MISSTLLNSVAQKLAKFSTQSDAEAMDAEKDWQKNLKAILTATLAKLHLVSREDYDIQVELLNQARQQLAELEQKVLDLSAQIKQHSPQNPE